MMLVRTVALLAMIPPKLGIEGDGTAGNSSMGDGVVDDVVSDRP